MDHFAASRGCYCNSSTVYETRVEDDAVVRILRRRLRQRHPPESAIDAFTRVYLSAMRGQLASVMHTQPSEE